MDLLNQTLNCFSTQISDGVSLNKDIFETNLINNFPEIEYVFEKLDEQLTYVSEAVKNIITIVSDLINSY